MEQRSQSESALAGAAYGMLFVLGLALGVVGGFTQASSWIGEIPVSAVGWVIVLFCVCFGVGRMMRTKLAASVLTIGWLLVSMMFSLKRGAGDLIITGDLAGVVYLYGGMAVLVVAVLMTPSAGGSWLLHQGPYGSQPK